MHQDDSLESCRSFLIHRPDCENAPAWSHLALLQQFIHSVHSLLHMLWVPDAQPVLEQRHNHHVAMQPAAVVQHCIQRLSWPAPYLHTQCISIAAASSHLGLAACQVLITRQRTNTFQHIQTSASALLPHGSRQHSRQCCLLQRTLHACQTLTSCTSSAHGCEHRLQ